MRPDTLRSTASALRYWEDRQQIAANNLANVETAGFKGQRVFARLLEERGVVAAQAVTDYRSGSITPTGAPLDLALEGAGFLVVDTPAGERWTRGGSFRLGADGTLLDGAGNALLGTGGPIVLPEEGVVEIDAAGAVRVDGVEVDRLRLEGAEAGEELVREAGGLFLPGAARAALDAEAVRVRQGHLESSNVDPIGSLVEMITIQRNFGAVQGAVRVLDGVLDTVATQIGRVS